MAIYNQGHGHWMSEFNTSTFDYTLNEIELDFVTEYRKIWTEIRPDPTSTVC